VDQKSRRKPAICACGVNKWPGPFFSGRERWAAKAFLEEPTWNVRSVLYACFRKILIVRVRVVQIPKRHMGVSENNVPLNPMVLLIIIPMKNGYFIGKINPIFRQTHMSCFCLCSIVFPVLSIPSPGARPGPPGPRRVSNEHASIIQRFFNQKHSLIRVYIT